MKGKFLEIAVLSYNRVKELERILYSLSSFSSREVSIVVYEDCSPNQQKIKELVNNFSNNLLIDIEFKPSKKNIGYDRNLIRALSSDSEYIMLLSDDDYLDASHLDDFLSFLSENKPDIVISPYINKQIFREGAHYLDKYSINVLYDSILFSGLVFRRGLISLSHDEYAFLKKSIYVQVYLVCKYWTNKCFYFNKPLLIAGSDGENFFGKSDISKDMESLRDRKKLMSNIHYQVYFQKVVYRCIERFQPNLKKDFKSNYSKRLVSHFIRIRLKTNFVDYFRSLIELQSINVSYKASYLIIIFCVAFIPNIILEPAYNQLIRKFRVSGG